jgi:hypothetical protein
MTFFTASTGFTRSLLGTYVIGADQSGNASVPLIRHAAGSYSLAGADRVESGPLQAACSG